MFRVSGDIYIYLHHLNIVNITKSVRSKTMDRLFTCDHCWVTIKTRTNLKRHIANFHSRFWTSYICPICEKSKSRKSDLKRHTATTHTLTQTIYKTETRHKITYHPRIESVKPWTPTFEATRFRIIPAQKPWLNRPTAEIARPSKTAMNAAAPEPTQRLTKAELLQNLYLPLLIQFRVNHMP